MPVMRPSEVAALADAVLRVRQRAAVDEWLRAVWDLRADAPALGRVTYRGALLPHGLGVRYRGGLAVAAGPAIPRG